MAKERFKLIPIVFLVLINKDKILLARRYNTGHADGQYSLVAGHLDGNETFREGMVREAAEEAGIRVSSDNLHVVHVLHRMNKADSRESLGIFFTTTLWQGTPRIMEPDKCDDMGWFPLDHLPENTVATVRQALECIQKNIIYSEFGWE